MQQQLQFDLIFVDPPTFSNSSKMAGSFDVQRDHVDMFIGEFPEKRHPNPANEQRKLHRLLVASFVRPDGRNASRFSIHVQP